MEIKGLSEKLSSMADDVEKKKIKRKIADTNGESSENLLEIPIIGGLCYIIAMFFKGKRVMREIRLKQNEGNIIKKIIKDSNAVKRALRIQLNFFTENYKVKEIEIPPENLAEFFEILKEFPQINASQVNGKENEFVLVYMEEVL